MVKHCVLFVFITFALGANAQLKVNTRALKGVSDGVKAATFSDADAAKLAKEAVDWMDKHNPVADAKDPYTIRLNKIVGKHTEMNGLKLNYKVYKVIDINAFACADGSVRVVSSLMDIMTDEELLGVIGHEIGHVVNHDTRDAMKQAYMRSAAANAAASQSNAVATLTDSELGNLANAMLSANFSRTQESAADDFSYDFLKQNNYNVVALATAFEKFAKMEEGTDKSKMDKMMSSHPDSKKRSENILKKAEKDGLKK